MELPWDRGTKVCSYDPGHMTNMAAMPIFDKNVKKIFSGTKRLMILKVCMQHRALKYYQVCSNDDPALTLTYFQGQICMAKVKTMDFSELIVV